MDYMIKILRAYIESTRSYLGGTRETLPAIAIYDMHKTNTADENVYALLAEINCFYSLIPAGLTKYVQPMDVYANAQIERIGKDIYNDWYAGKVLEWINSGKDVKDFVIDTRWSVMKPIHARWLVQIFNSLPADVMSKSFELAGIKSYDPSLDSNHN